MSECLPNKTKGAPSKANQTRRVILNGKQLDVFQTNKIISSKYSVISFLPKFLFQEFCRYSNLFFLFIVAIQQIKHVSPTGRYATLTPLCTILTMAGIKEIIEERTRRKSDVTTNLRLVNVYRKGDWVRTEWQDVMVGDIVKVLEGETFPADIVLLSSSEPQAMCYIETSNLDGETNLKIRQGLCITSCIETLDCIKGCRGIVECELPNTFLYKFTGSIWFSSGVCEDLSSCGSRASDKSKKSIASIRSVGKGAKKTWYDLVKEQYDSHELQRSPLGPENILLRGASLKNTAWIIGIVIYTGTETKLCLSNSGSKFKRTKVDGQTNTQIFLIILMMLTFAISCAYAQDYWQNINSLKHWYLFFAQLKGNNFILNVLTYIVIYESFIPISLQITVNMVKFFQAFFINWDRDMYYDKTKTFAHARTSNLNEELGQIKFIFSDKTGTLTQNIMEFKRCSIAGDIYGGAIDSSDKFDETGLLKTILTPDVDTGIKSRKLEVILKKSSSFASESTESDWMEDEMSKSDILAEFCRILAVCHTVVPQVNEKTHDIQYLATSPDENALVKGAAQMKYKLLSRAPTSVTINALGIEETYEVLNILEFTSKRKRMSVIVRDPQGQLKLYCKGADNVIFERLSQDTRYTVETLEHLEQFATIGLRTLCIAFSYIEPEFYSEWSTMFQKASNAIEEREERLEDVAELIEKELLLLGSTAIEDKLQDGVPDTIHDLLDAGITIWVLTGDRQDTAINIGYSCQLLTEGMDLIIMNAESLNDTKDALANHKEKFGNLLGQDNLVGFVIDGECLKFALSPECQVEFLEVALSCRAVLCCRVSPKQKSDIVMLVRNNHQAVTLAIGDGANDVKMIQTAHVGVGISGEEGLQAASASDYSIAQFRFLKKLLLVHGSWSYLRICHTIKYTFYKNICLYFTNFLYQFSNGFSGQILYDAWSLILFNVMFTSFPPLIMGLFDRTVTSDTAMKNPGLYADSQAGRFFTPVVFWTMIMTAMVHSTVIYYTTMLLLNFDPVCEDANTAGYLFTGVFLMGYVVVTVNVKSCLETLSWTLPTYLCTGLSILSWSFYIFLISQAYFYLGISPEVYGLSLLVFHNPVFWLGLITIPVVALLLDLIIKTLCRDFCKDYLQAIQELEVSAVKRRLSMVSRPSGMSRKGSKGRTSQETKNRITELVEGQSVNAATPHPWQESHTGYAFSQDYDGQMSQSEFIHSQYSMPTCGRGGGSQKSDNTRKVMSESNRDTNSSTVSSQMFFMGENSVIKSKTF